MDGQFTPRQDQGPLHARPQPPRTAWAKAKIRLLEYWDYPPAALFWLVLTAITVGLFKVAGL